MWRSFLSYNSSCYYIHTSESKMPWIEPVPYLKRSVVIWTEYYSILVNDWYCGALWKQVANSRSYYSLLVMAPHSRFERQPTESLNSYGPQDCSGQPIVIGSLLGTFGVFTEYGTRRCNCYAFDLLKENAWWTLLLVVFFVSSLCLRLFAFVVKGYLLLTYL
jgi:hypothetical protein